MCIVALLQSSKILLHATLHKFANLCKSENEPEFIYIAHTYVVTKVNAMLKQRIHL